MKKYMSFFRIRFSNGLQYRAAAFAGILTQFAWGFMELLLFEAFYRADAAAFPMTFSQLASYIWLQQAFLALFMAWFVEGDILLAITGGGIAYELSRPMDLFGMWFVKSMASRLSKAVLRCMPILLVAAFLPKPYRISPPPDLKSFMMFLITLALGFLTVVSFCMLIYAATFYTLSPLGVRIAAISLTELLSGSVIPLPFLPDTLRAVVECTPFAAMQNLPLRVYSGNIAGAELTSGVALQVFWLAAMTLGGWLWIRRAINRIVVQGG